MIKNLLMNASVISPLSMFLLIKAFITMFSSQANN